MIGVFMCIGYGVDDADVFANQLRVQVGSVALEKRQRSVREHHAEAERRIGRVLLVDVDLPARKAAANQQGEEQSGRAGAQDRELHAGILSPA